MLFTSAIFLCLLLVTFTLYYLPVFKRHQTSLLISSSLIFYGYNEPALLLLLLLSVGINIISSYYVTYGRLSYQKAWAVAGVTLNLALLCFFKYSPLLSATFFNSSSSIGAFLLAIPLPIGISFFTFQGISLVVDVYKEKYFRREEVVPASFIQHAKRVLFFKSFFPQLISGPIVKAHDFIPQINTKFFRDIDWENCFRILTTGYFLKMVVADNLKEFTFYISYPYFQSQSSLSLISMLFGYSFQIFADFAGYSLMAIGFAKLFGYDFKKNFDFPYLSASFKEFWKRWHISLSSFLMEYLYIPLGGNRKGALRTYFNLMLTMVLGGLWHGAAWSYAIWGAFHGLALATERFLTSRKWTIRVPLILNILFVFFFVTLAWLLFRLPDFQDVIAYFKAIYNNRGMKTNPYFIAYILIYSFPIVIYHLLYYFQATPLVVRTLRYNYILYALMLLFIVINSGKSGDFIYFQF